MLLCLTRSDGPWAQIQCPHASSQHSIILGRRPGPDGITLDVPSVPSLLSRKHCSLRQRAEDGLLEVTDLGSVNGTFVAVHDNTAAADAQEDDQQQHRQHMQRLPAHIPHVLEPGSSMLLGGRETVVGQHGQAVSNPFVFLVCQAADTEQRDEGAAAAATQATADRSQQQEEVQHLSTTGDAGRDASAPVLLLQHLQQQGALQPLLQQQHMQADSQQAAQPAASNPHSSSNEAGRGQDVLQDISDSSFRQHSSSMNADIPWQESNSTAAEPSRSVVVGIIEPAVKRRRRSSSLPPPTNKAQPHQQQQQQHHDEDEDEEHLVFAGGAVHSQPLPQQWMAAADCPCSQLGAGPGPAAASSPQQSPLQAARRPAAAAAATALHSQQARSTVGSRQDVRRVSACHLTCVICRGLLVATHTLVCGHLFCGPCLAQWIEVQAQPSCPSCRTSVKCAPVRMYRFDEIVAEAAASSGSEPQDLAARLEAWNAIKEDTAARWHAMFSSSSSKAGRTQPQGTEAAPAAAAVASDQQARAVRWQGRAEAVHLHRREIHLLTGLRQPDAGGAAGRVPGAANTRLQGSRSSGRRKQQRRGSSRAAAARVEVMQQQNVAPLRRAVAVLQPPPINQQQNNNSSNARLRQTAIDAFIH